MATNQISTSPYLLSDSNQASYRYNGEIPPDEALEQQALNRRQHIANLLIQQGLSGSGQGQMVGRFYVPPSPIQGLSDLAKVGLGAYGTYKNDEARGDLAAKNQQILADAVAKWKKDSADQSVTTELEGPGAPSGQGAAQPPTTQTSPQAQLESLLGPDPDQSNLPKTIPNDMQPAVGGVQIHNPNTGGMLPPPATPPIPSWANMGAMSGQSMAPVADTLAQQRSGPTEGPRPTRTTTVPRTSEEKRQAIIENLLLNSNPQAQRVGQIVLGELDKSETREAASTEKTTQREWQHQENRDKIDAKLESDKNHIDLLTGLKLMSIEEGAKAKKDADDRHATLLTTLNKSTTQTSRENNAATNAARIEAAQIAADARRDTAANKGGNKLPSAIGGKFMENSQNLRMAERAQALISGQTVEGAKGDPNATGMKNYLPDVVMQRMDPGGVETRAAVANLGSMIIHDRSGAAVTASEYPRLKPFIPAATDDPATVKKKLGQFVTEYRKINDEMTQFYGEAGYNVPSSDWHQSPEVTAPPATGMTPTVPAFHDEAKQKRYDEWKKQHKP